MADRISEQRRSWNMSRIRGRDTLPERTLRCALHRAGFRFRLRSRLPGRPDIVLPRFRTAIFVHGCFWHRHHGCELAYVPKSNEAFWKKKFEANMQRDRIVEKALRQRGWRVVVVWQCQIERNLDRTVSRVVKTLKR
jgi:DNA mismatch endonuclease (patch repair protein)